MDLKPDVSWPINWVRIAREKCFYHYVQYVSSRLDRYQKKYLDFCHLLMILKLFLIFMCESDKAHKLFIICIA